MELNWLKYFYEVARVQSVTQAGRQLRVSQPAVTKTIRQLENQLGYRLFSKSGRNIRLTSEGQQLYHHCVPLFKKVEQIKTLQKGINADWEGTVRLGASDNLCNYVLPGVIQQVQKTIPKADWGIYSGSSKEIKQRIVSGEVDFGLFYTEISLSEQTLLREQRIFEVPFVAVCSSKYGKSMTLAQLKSKDLTYVGVRFADYSNTLPEQWIVKNLDIAYSKKIQINSKETQKRIVQSGTGFGIFPQFMVKTEVESKKLTAVKGTIQPMTLRVVHRADENLTPAAELVIETLKKAL